eukprot:6982191-Prymnesium_polylepis.1
MTCFTAEVFASNDAIFTSLGLTEATFRALVDGSGGSSPAATQTPRRRLFGTRGRLTPVCCMPPRRQPSGATTRRARSSPRSSPSSSA